MSRHTVSVLVQDQPGVLSRVASLFARARRARARSAALAGRRPQAFGSAGDAPAP